MLGVFRLRRLEYIHDKLTDISVDKSFVLRVILIQGNLMPSFILAYLDSSAQPFVYSDHSPVHGGPGPAAQRASTSQGHTAF